MNLELKSPPGILCTLQFWVMKNEWGKSKMKNNPSPLRLVIQSPFFEECVHAAVLFIQPHHNIDVVCLEVTAEKAAASVSFSSRPSSIILMDEGFV